MHLDVYLQDGRHTSEGTNQKLNECQEEWFQCGWYMVIDCGVFLTVDLTCPVEDDEDEEETTLDYWHAANVKLIQQLAFCHTLLIKSHGMIQVCCSNRQLPPSQRRCPATGVYQGRGNKQQYPGPQSQRERGEIPPPSPSQNIRRSSQPRRLCFTAPKWANI